MSLSSGRHARLPVFQFVLLTFALGLSCLPSSAQQPKVLAPHRPVAPRLHYSAPSADSYVPRFLRGGFWMTDEFTKSTVYVHTDLEISSLPVVPVLYLSNGVKLTLPAITLQPNGTAVIAINEGLASQGISPYATLSGYVELDYQWPWNALCATVSSVDATHSVIFTYGLSSESITPVPGGPPMNPSMSAPGAQVLEGAWWKEEAGVTGFVSLSNTTDRPLPATVQVTDANAQLLGAYQLTVSPHGTKTVQLQELAPSANSLGGLQVTFKGLPDAIIVNGSLEDLSKGYSAGIPFGLPPDPSAKPVALSYAEIGLMTGAADPMMRFPGGTVFKPFSVVRNLATQPIAVTPVLYWTQGGVALSSRLTGFSLAPLQTASLDMSSLLALTGLKNFNGTVSLVLEAQGPAGSVLLASGSVDQSYTYVFEVTPRSVKESTSKNLAYWSTANGDDTMVTLWNPADEAQDFLFKFFFSGGHYLLPIHLGPRATHMFNLSEVIENQIPDDEGNVIPPSVHEGSAKISGMHGVTEHILLAMDSGTYNVRKATCRWVCINCDGVVSFELLPSQFTTLIGGSTQLALTTKWNDGGQYDVSGSSVWASSDTSIATVKSGLVQGVAGGGVIITGQDLFDPVAGQVCGNAPGPDCPPMYGGSDGATGTVQVPTYFIPTGSSTTLNVFCAANQAFYVYVDYQLADQYKNPITVAGLTPEESVSANGGPYSPFKSFATPASTPASGAFEDIPLGTCFSAPPPPNRCIPVAQKFQILVPGVSKPFPITTTTSDTECEQGIVINVNPIPPGTTYSYGSH